MTYSINGEQFVAVMAGYGGAPTASYPEDATMHEYQNYGRILAFKLHGNATPLPPRRTEIEVPEPPEIQIKSGILDKGVENYMEYCGSCHGGFGPNHRSQHPDLSKMQKGTHTQFSDIVIGGILSGNGMASFSHSITEEEVEAIFLIKMQTDLYNEQEKNKLPKRIPDLPE